MKVENDLLHEATKRELNHEEYEQLFIFITNTPHNFLNDTLSPSEIIKILSYLNFYQEETYEISKGLAKYFLLLFPDEFAYSSSDLLISILTSENYILSILIFDELSRRIVGNGPQNELIQFSSEFVQLISKFLFNENLDLSRASQKLLINYYKQSREMCKTSFQSIIKSELIRISSNSVYLFRYFDVVLEIGLTTMDREMFELVIDKELINQFNAFIVGDDILSHVNVLELIRRLIGHQLGYQLATESGLLNNLHSELPKISQGVWNGILLSGYLNIFVELCRNHCVEALKSYREFVNVLNENFTNPDLILRNQVLEIASVIVSIPDCKFFINSEYEYLIPKALKELLKLFNHSSTEYQIRSGNSLSNIFRAPNDHKDFQSLSQINHQWFSEINKGGELIAHMLKLIKLPLEDLKFTGYQLAVAISNQNWAIPLIVSNTQFVDFLMIRADEFKSCIDLKFELITNIFNELNQNPNLCLSNANNAQHIQQYFHEGKYFAPRNYEMMIDTDV